MRFEGKFPRKGKKGVGDGNKEDEGVRNQGNRADGGSKT